MTFVRVVCLRVATSLASPAGEVLAVPKNLREPWSEGCWRPGQWLGHHPTIASQAYFQLTTRGGVGSRDPGAPALKWLMSG